MMDDWEPGPFPTKPAFDDNMEPEALPLLPVRDTVLFPYVAAHLFG